MRDGIVAMAIRLGFIRGCQPGHSLSMIRFANDGVASVDTLCLVPN